MAKDNTVSRERVVAGAALLDQDVPDWYINIDCAILNTTSNKHCVLAQVYGDYGYGLRELNIFGLGRKQGFFSWTLSGNEILTELWRELIAQRRLVLLKEQTQLVVHG